MYKHHTYIIIIICSVGTVVTIQYKTYYPKKVTPLVHTLTLVCTIMSSITKRNETILQQPSKYLLACALFGGCSRVH
jgi:hypothetical protein